MGFRICLILLLFCLLFVPLTLSAQNPENQWWSDQFHLPGLDDQVNCIVEFDGDLVLGGEFTHGEKAEFRHIVRWDGSRFRSFGGELTQVPKKFEVFGPALFALMHQGEDLPEGASKLIWFDGDEWHPVFFSPGALITTIKTIDDKLIVAGNFSSVAGVDAQNIASFDGVQWSSIGNGLDTTVTAIGALNGTVVAAVTRRFEDVHSYEWAETMAWDGTAWTSWGFAPPIAAVADYEAYNGELYMVGPSNETDKPLFARLTAQGWDLVDIGLDHYILAPVYDLHVFNGQLYAVGWFTFEPDNPYGNTAVIRWDGISWQDTETPFNGHAFALCEFQGDLITGGPFTQVGPYGASFAARFHNEYWRPLSDDFVGLGTPGEVWCVHAKDSILVVGGNFRSVGDVAASSIALFRNGKWEAMGSGCTYGWSGSRVEDIVYYQNMFVACASRGLFVGADGRKGPIAGYDGQQWTILGDNAPAATHLAVYNGDLICALNSDVYRLDGSTWTKISPTLSGLIDCMAVYRGELLIGGTLNTSIGVYTRVAMRFDGSSWISLALPANFVNLYDMHEFKGGLYFAGRGNPLDGGVRNIARWDGQTWTGVPGRDVLSGFSIVDLETYGTLLVATGGLRYTSNGDSSRFIAGFDGAVWHPLGAGIDSQFTVQMTPYLGGLVIGGPLRISGKKPSIGIAFWRPDHDLDALFDGNDNCAYRYNPDQADITGDGIGDACCCVGTTGDFNQSQTLDLTDLSILITILTGSYSETLPCPYETYADGYAGITLSDLSQLVAYFTQSPKPQLPSCP